jgi:hypothetical protein
MSSLVQITSNQQNAQKSTGPKSSRGKKKASQNALVHGVRSNLPVLPTESAEQWETHRLGILTSLQPAGTLEMALVERIASCLWRLNRVVSYETMVTTIEQEEAEEDLKEKDHSQDELGFSSSKSDTAQLEKIDQEIHEEKENQHYWEKAKSLMEQLRDLPDEALVDGEAVEGMLSDLNGSTPEFDEEYLEFDDPDILKKIGLPKEAWKAPFEGEYWTARLARKAWQFIATEFHCDANQLLERALKESHQSLQEQVETIRDLEAQAKALRQRISQRVEYLRMRRIIPNQGTMEKITRYEAHLSRQMLQAMQTLERLQAARKGEEVLPPTSVSVVVDLPPQKPMEEPLLEAITHS